MAVDERAAISQMQRGDIGGLELLVRTYQVRAVRAAYLVTHDRALAEDIVQTAFVRAFERIGQFDAARPFGPWFLHSVVNDASKAATRGRRFEPFDVEHDDDARQVADPAPGPEQLLLRAESDADVWAALDALSPAHRSAIVLRYHLDLPEAAVAGRLGIAPGTAKSRLHHARKRLQLTLSGLRPHRAISDRPPTDREPESLTIDRPNHTPEGSAKS